MSEFNHKDTEALTHLAEEVEQERKTKGHTPFDDIPDTDGDATTREDHDEAAHRIEAFGTQNRPSTPGL